MAKQEKSAAELYREERKQRIAKAAKNNSKKHISDKTQKTIVSVIAIVLVIAIVGAITGGIVKNKGVFERNKVIMTIGDTEIDKYEYAYYYSSTLQNLASQAAQFDMYYGNGMGAMYVGYDYTLMPDEQAFSGEIEGIEEPTYADYFGHQAIESLKYVKACLAYAAENGIELEDEDYAKVDETFATIEENRVNEDGSKYSVGAYLRLSYGDGMTEKLFRRIMEEQTLAQKVMEIKQEEFAASYSDEEVEETYKKGIENYGVVSLRSYTFDVEKDEDAEKATDKQIAAAKSKAEAFKSKLTDEKSFKTIASEYAELADDEDYKDYLTDDSLTLEEDSEVSNYSTDEKLLDWVKSAKAGDTYVVSTDTDSTVYMMVEPVHKADDSKTYDVRHILIKFPEEEDTEEEAEATDETADSEEAEEAKEEKTEDKQEVEVKELDTSKYDVTVVNNVKTPVTDAESYNKAVDVLTAYLEGDKTEDDFANLAMLHSADGNASEGGIYEDVTEGYMVAEFENWALDEERKEGDVGIVETTYGYHIMYFIDAETTTWSDTIRSDLATEKYSEFTEELVEADNVKAGEIDADMEADVDERMEKLARNLYNSIQSQMSSYSYY
ncbi:MAG: hypothetical protein E7538_04965 [Ruminococcaceae bacterium]|nr:hypothetical protein [Oscillospiraceae bacterium]